MVERCSSLTIAFILVLLFPFTIQAQSFNSGLRKYKQRNYEQAALAFSKVDSPEAKLFAAKSYYALGRFKEAANILNELLPKAVPDIYYEAAYTSALIDFQQKKYADALTKLYIVNHETELNSLADDAKVFYRQLLEYLTAKQRVKALQNVGVDQIKYDLLKTALGKVSFSALKEIIEQFNKSVDEKKWRQKGQDIESSLTNEPAYKIKYGEDYGSFSPPTGTVYNIGIVLPKPDTDKPTFAVVKGLYLGARLAANQFNNNHSNVKAYVTFLPTDGNDLDDIVSSFMQEKQGDFIIGPLFSEQAEQMVSISDEYQLPIIAPLATSDIKSGASLFYQANSSFSMQGKVMAHYAVDELGLNNFAIIAGENRNGKKSAQAFRETVEALGAKVVSFQIEDFEESNYDISAYIKKMESELEKADAIYAPFTDNYTEHLVEQLTNTINTFEKPLTLLGSPKWEDINFSTDIYSRSDIFYPVNSFRHGNLNRFHQRYQRNFRIRANKFSLIGYDISHYLLNLIDQIGNPALLNKTIAKTTIYRGLIKNIYFNDSHENNALQILKINSSGHPVLLKCHMK